MRQPPVLNSPDVVRSELALLIGPEDRTRHGLWIFLCDDQARGVTVSPVDDVPTQLTDAECERALSGVAMALEELGGQLLVALTRPGNGVIGEWERRWFRAVHAVCGRSRVGVLGVWVVTPREIVQIHPDDAV